MRAERRSVDEAAEPGPLAADAGRGGGWRLEMYDCWRPGLRAGGNSASVAGARHAAKRGGELTAVTDALAAALHTRDSMLGGAIEQDQR